MSPKGSPQSQRDWGLRGWHPFPISRRGGSSEGHDFLSAAQPWSSAEGALRTRPHPCVMPSDSASP